MAVASLVLGIISILIAWIPLCGSIAGLPAFIGLILGIVALVQSKKNNGENKGMGIAGTVLNALALIIITVYTLVFTAAAISSEGALEELDNVADSVMQELNDSLQSISDSIQSEIENEFSDSIADDIANEVAEEAANELAE